MTGGEDPGPWQGTPAAGTDAFADLQAQIRQEARRFGGEIEYWTQIGSTNDRARELARAGAPEGTVVLADEQVRGRGRRGHTWTAPPGQAILASLLLRPGRPLAEAFAPTMILGLAIRAAALAWDVPAVLKWPNDVLSRGRKLAGILCEMPFIGDVPAFVVAGFGVNVTFDPAAIGLAEVATSLHLEVPGPPPARAAVLDRILAEAEARYRVWQQGGYAAVWTEWQMALATLGTPVRVDVGEAAPVEGIAVRVERDGTLVVATVAGERALIAGAILL